MVAMRNGVKYNVSDDDVEVLLKSFYKIGIARSVFDNAEKHFEGEVLEFLKTYIDDLYFEFTEKSIKFIASYGDLKRDTKIGVKATSEVMLALNNAGFGSLFENIMKD